MAPLSIKGIPPVYAGVLQLGCAVVPVVDLRANEPMDSTCRKLDASILLVEVRGQEVGLIVDGVNGVIALTTEQLEPSVGQIEGPFRPYVTCIKGISEVLALLDWPGSAAG